MERQPWLEQVRRELVHKRLPPAYVERLVFELSDHINDFMEDRMSTDAKDLRSALIQLGRPNEIAQRAAAEYRHARFSGRHPAFTFLVMPIIALPLMWAGCIAGLVALAKIAGFSSDNATAGGPLWQWANLNLPLILLVILVLPVAVAALFFCRLATRASVGWKWPLAACLVLALIGGLAISDVALPAGGTKGSVRFGFALSRSPTEAQLVQFAVPVAIGAWAAWREISRRRRCSLA
jgi:hypothetical protein